MIKEQTLMMAAVRGEALTISASLEVCRSVNAPNEHGETPLMRAAAQGHSEIVKHLIEAGAEVNARRSDGITALIRASFFGHLEATRILLQAGADMGATDRLGLNAKAWALAKGHDEVAALLSEMTTHGLDAVWMKRAAEDHTYVVRGPELKPSEPKPDPCKESSSRGLTQWLSEAGVDPTAEQKKHRFQLTLLEEKSRPWLIPLTALLLSACALTVLFILTRR
jgi:hypothetical protein